MYTLFSKYSDCHGNNLSVWALIYSTYWNEIKKSIVFDQLYSDLIKKEPFCLKSNRQLTSHRKFIEPNWGQIWKKLTNKE